jgi:hypothetical protein
MRAVDFAVLASGEPDAVLEAITVTPLSDATAGSRDSHGLIVLKGPSG